MSDKEELVTLAASKVHEDWCIQELKGFWERAKTIKTNNEEQIKKGIIVKEGNSLIDKAKNKFGIKKEMNEVKELNPGEILKMACYKNGIQRNEIFIDIPFIQGHESTANNSLTSFEDFLWLVQNGGYDIKRFIERNLTTLEIEKSSENYKKETKEENILRPFKELSADSKKENVSAAIGAYNIFEQMSKAGITIEQMENNPEVLSLIGVAIHADWLKRNIEHPDDSLKVSYEQLDNWTKEQDIIVFKALLNVVKQNKDKYLIEPIEGYQLPNYYEEENQILESIGKGHSR